MQNALYYFTIPMILNALYNLYTVVQTAMCGYLCHVGRHKYYFGLIHYIQVNSYDHVNTVSSHSHTYFLGKLG